MRKTWFFNQFLYGLRYLYLLYVVTIGLLYFLTYLQDGNFSVVHNCVIYSLFFLLCLTIYLFSKSLVKMENIEEAKKLLDIDVLSRWKEGTVEESELISFAKSLSSEQRKRIEELLNQQQELTNTYSMWSHQIKVPISVLDLMVQTKDVDVDVMKDQLLTINQYLEIILQYVRMNTTETDYRFEPVRLRKMVNTAVKKYASFFIKKDLSLEILGEDVVIQTDEKWLQFVFEQLLYNAIKYTKEGKITIHLDEKSLGIEDTGIGILEEDLPRIMKPGFTGLNGRIDKKASGLGLFLSKEVLGKLGYSLTVESTINVGSTFTIHFEREGEEKSESIDFD